MSDLLRAIPACLLGDKEVERLGKWTEDNVVPLRAHEPGREVQLRRLAIQIAGQLPQETDDALRVLDLAAGLVRTFLDVPGQA